MAELAKDGTIREITCKCGKEVFYKKEESKWNLYSDSDCSTKHNCGKSNGEH